MSGMTGTAIIAIALCIVAALAVLGWRALCHFTDVNRRPWDKGYPVRRRPEDE